MSLCDAYMPEASEWSKEFGMLEQNVLNIVSSLNYEVKVLEEEEKTLLVEKSAAATACWGSSSVFYLFLATRKSGRMIEEN